MHVHVFRSIMLFVGLCLLAGLSGAARADTPAPTPGFERVEVAALRIAHRDFQRPVRILVRAGEMATLDFDSRAFGLRVLVFDARSATIEVVELEQVQAMGPGKGPEYRETRVVERLLVEPGRGVRVAAFDIELAFSIDELIRAPSVDDCPADPVAPKDLGAGDQCCLRCQNVTACGSCVTSACGWCCAP
jgi:hypothetical protein